MNGFSGTWMVRGKRAAGWLATAALALAVSGCGPRSPSASELTQGTCPVMGVSVKSAYFVDYQGKRIYFCCSGCVKTFSAHAEKYMKEMEQRRVHLQTAPPIPSPPILRAAHPCACVPGTERPSLTGSGEGLCLLFADPAGVAKGETPEHTQERLAKGVPQERAPPGITAMAG